MKFELVELAAAVRIQALDERSDFGLVHALEATSDEGSHMSSVVIWLAFIYSSRIPENCVVATLCLLSLYGIFRCLKNMKSNYTIV